MLNVAACDPAETTTVFPSGKNAAGSLLDSVTNVPPGSAGPLRETVPDSAVAPPTTKRAFRVSCVSNRGSTVRLAFSVTRWYVAEIVTGVDAATAAVETRNAALCDPAGIVTVFPSGKDAAGSRLDNVTAAPSSGAGPPRSTSPDTVVALPTTECTSRATFASNGGRPDVLRTT